METSKLVEQIAARVSEKLAQAAKKTQPEQKPCFRIDKKAVTERMISDAYDNGFRTISIRPDSILTANAKEVIHAFDIEVIRN